MTKQLELEDTCRLLGSAYVQWKEHEQDKNEHKNKFFELADEVVEYRGRQARLVEVEATDEETAAKRALLHNPGWLLDVARPHHWKKGLFEVLLWEDPQVQPFSVEVDGVKYSRQVQRGSVLVDDDWLQEDNPDLYQKITYLTPWNERMMYPLSFISEEDMAKLGKYIYYDKPKVKLAPPQAVKEEE